MKTKGSAFFICFYRNVEFAMSLFGNNHGKVKKILQKLIAMCLLKPKKMFQM